MNTESTNQRAEWPPPSTAVSYDEYLKLSARGVDVTAHALTLNQRIAVERILVLAFGRAILMQYAHPAIAAAVARHSYSSQSDRGKAERFRRTMALRMRLTFGDPQTVWQAARQIDRLHASVWGEVTSNDGGGTLRYSARDPELIKWVHATVVDSTLVVYQAFVRRLTASQRNEYLSRASMTGPLLGAPGPILQDESELRAYLERYATSGVLCATEDARRLSAEMMKGLPVPIIGGVANAMGRTLIRALLPPWCATVYGTRPSLASRTVLCLSAGSYKFMRPLLPRRLTRWPAGVPATAGRCPMRLSSRDAS